MSATPHTPPVDRERYTPSDLSGMADYLRNHGWLVAPPQREGVPVEAGHYVLEIDASDWRLPEVRVGEHLYNFQRAWGPVEVSQ